MVRQSVRVRGSEQWRLAIKALGIRVDHATDAATTEAGRHVERAVKIELTTYTHRAGTPTPAPPGGPPALITGTLMRSVRKSRTIRRRRGVYRTEVGPQARYARIQELGGRAGARHRATLPARPYQKPRTYAELVEIHRTYKRHWREATKT